MTRFALIFLVACEGAKVPPANLVCERIRLVDDKAECTPELTDVGEMHTHRARVKQGDAIVVCSLTDRMVSMACDGLVPAPKPDAPK